jgi:hypothetical protein
MLYAPLPWPSVPGMSTELRPPNAQPASSTAPEPMATVFRLARKAL